MSGLARPVPIFN